MSAGSNKNKYLVVFVGTDGSGKTTLATGLQKNLPNPVQYVYFGLKDFYLPGLNRLVERKGDGGLLFRLLFLPIEYIIRRARLHHKGVIVFDRIPGWAFSGKSRILFFIYRLVLPRVDLLVHCTGRPQSIIKRKPERSLEACKKDIKKWELVTLKYPARKRLTLDTTTQSIDSCLVQLGKLVSDASAASIRG